MRVASDVYFPKCHIVHSVFETQTYSKGEDWKQKEGKETATLLSFSTLTEAAHTPASTSHRHLPWIYTVYSSSGLVQYRSSFLQCTLDESLFPVGDTLSVICVCMTSVCVCVYLSVSFSISAHYVTCVREWSSIVRIPFWIIWRVSVRVLVRL